MKNTLQNGDWAKFEKATDGDLMLWKLEHPDEKIGS
jgi:hypothetical protein